MKKTYNILLLTTIILFSSFITVFAEDFIIEKITFLNRQYTAENYLLRKANIKVGQNWDEKIKAQVIRNLKAQTRIIEDVIINETFIDGKVSIEIDLTEKLPFLPVPLFSYSSASGFKPKLLFRHYNLFGRAGYLNFKYEFSSKGDTAVYFDFSDLSFLDNDNLQFNLNSYFKTSVINFFVTNTPILGTTEYTSEGKENDNELRRWSEDYYYKAAVSTNIKYSIPNICWIQPFTYIYYEKILVDELNYNNPKDKIDTTSGLLNAFSLGEGYTIYPSIAVRNTFEVAEPNKKAQSFNLYYTTYSDESAYYNYRNTNNTTKPLIPVTSTEVKEAHDNSLISAFFRHYAIPYAKIAVDIYLPFLEMTYSPDIRINFGFSNNYFETKTNRNTTIEHIDTTPYQFNDKPYTEYFSDIEIGNTFKKIDRIGPITNYITLDLRIKQILYDMYYYDGKFVKNFNIKDSIKMRTLLTYKMDYKFINEHNFIMQWNLFYFFNGLNTEPWVYDDDSNYDTDDMGKRPGDMKGWVGITGHLSYKLPLFDFNTPNFGTFSTNKNLRWKIDWYFFIDGGLAQNYDSSNDDEFEDDLISTKIHDRAPMLNLHPALGLGTKVEFLPQFIPAKAYIAIAIDAWALVRNEGFSASIEFKFGIDNQ